MKPTIIIMMALSVVTLIIALGAAAIALGFIPGLGNQYTFSGVVIRSSIQQMSVLTTTRFNYSYTIRSEMEMPALLQALYGQQQLLVAVGSVTAGVDLSQLEDEDVTLASETLTINIPSARLLDCFLDESATYVVERNTGLFAQSSPTLDSEARRYSVTQFRNAALEQGILQVVESQVETSITELVRILSQGKVNELVFQHDMPSSDIPSTCGVNS